MWFIHTWEHLPGVLIGCCLPPSLCFLHCLQFFGSCVNPLSLKNPCSPAEKTKVVPQSTHFSSLSIKSIDLPISSGERRYDAKLIGRSVLPFGGKGQLKRLQHET